MKKVLPMSEDKLLSLVSKIPTPFYLYDEQGIINTVNEFNSAFSWAKGFCNFFAVKALPNPSVIKTLAAMGMGADASSLPEIYLAKDAGCKRIIYTSNDTPDEEFKVAYENGAILNLDDITHIDVVKRVLGFLPETLCFRYNPGPERTGNAIIGNPVEAKYGLTTDQLILAYKRAKEEGVKTFGLHTMVASNELNPDYIVQTAAMLFSLVARVKNELDIDISFIDMGGGIGIPYKEEDDKMDLNYVSAKMKELYDAIIVPLNIDLEITFECGRCITGPHGYLVSKVLHVATKYKTYVGLDACMANLMRPALYGAYHHITQVGKSENEKDTTYDVVGSLCENNDKFAIDRKLAKVDIGDTVVFHDAGAHAWAMGFNYNAKLRCAEYYLHSDSSVELIRRRETYEDYTATLNFEKETIKL